MDGDVQFGFDVFNIGVGKGGGMVGFGGGCVGNVSYSQYLVYVFQCLLWDNLELCNLVFCLQVEIWLSFLGDIIWVELICFSGDFEIDQKVLVVLCVVGCLEECLLVLLILLVCIVLQGKWLG